MAAYDLALSDAGCPSGLSAPAEQGAAHADPEAFVRQDKDGRDLIELIVPGATCAGCIRKIEGGLRALPGVREARLNLSTARLFVSWSHGALSARDLVETLAALGYQASAFDPDVGRRAVDQEGRLLLRCLAVAGFAAMNIMMFSVPIWSGAGEMGPGARTLLHFFSAIVAVPCALYAGQPFFRSAWNALKHRRTNMDVPISLAVFLTLGMSIAETLQRGAHAYFDGVVMLLFFLLLGRYLDHQLREKARAAAKDVLAMQAAGAARIEADGRVTAISAHDICIGDRLLIAAGDRIPADGVVSEGVSEIDNAMLTGETAPEAVRPGAALHAGAVNLSHRLIMRATALVEDSAVAKLARLIEVGEQGRAKFVRLADRAASLYAPVVHAAALTTFLAWMFMGDVGVRTALQNAVAVLIITCPCALGLSVPAVQIVATGRLFRRGVLVRSGDALERFAQIDTVVFDKTGTLTLGKPRLVTRVDVDTLKAAAQLARGSRHPLSRALVEAAGIGGAAADARECPGEGVEGTVDGRPARLGRRTFAAPLAADANDGHAELWFAWGAAPARRFAFTDALRADAAEVVAALKQRGLRVELVSGDRASAVAEAAGAVGIEAWTAAAKPADKIARLEALRAAGRKVLMVGDGLNDAAALVAAHASASPGTAIEASQAASDVVIQGAALTPLIEVIDMARVARRRVFENIAFSVIYNLVAAPAAALGFLTPLIAALAMSGSSMAVTLNALRLSLTKVRA